MKSQITIKAAVAAGLFGTALGASAATTIFSTTLGAAGEPVPTSFATGAAIVSFDDVADTVTVQLSFQGLANNAPFGHIHCCTTTPGTGNAPVALNFTPLPSVTTGTYSNVFALTPTAFDALFAGAVAGRAYVNIHTPGLYGGGEIRGFLPAGVIPEPGTYALMLAGLAAVVGVARRQRKG
jgi:CHRD domain/PEP-CTERM motif